MFVDNTAAIDLANKLGVGARTAHFLRWQHYLRWIVYHKYGVVLWIDTNNQTADIMTKVVASTPYLKHKATFLNKGK